MTAAHARRFALLLFAAAACADSVAAADPQPAAHPLIRVAFTLQIGADPATRREWLAEPGVPFTLDEGDGAARWRIVATAHERKDGTFKLDATLSCGGRIARRAHVLTAGRDNIARIAAQSATCPEARREIAAEIRMRTTGGEAPGEDSAPSWRMFYKVCWDAHGGPTSIDFLRAEPEGFAGTSDPILASMRTWTFGQADKRPGRADGAIEPGCATIVVDIN